MKRTVVVHAVLLLLCLNVNGQDPPVKKYQSLLWEITGNGLTKPSYLYGTMHVSDKVAFHLNDTFFAAVGNCDMVALEIDADQWYQKNRDIAKARNSIEYESTNPTYNFYKNSFSLDLPSSDDLKDMIETYPSIISHILYRTYDDSKNFEEDTYLDMFIYQLGKKMNKKTGGLEDFIQSEVLANKAYEYYYSDYYSDKDYDKKEIRLKELMKGYYSISELFDDAYRAGNLDLVDTLEKLLYPKRYLEYLVIKRNVNMANSMDSIMKYASLFAAVGCAHLPGDSGVISLLRKKGYVLRPVNYQSLNGIDPNIRLQLEKTRIPLSFTLQYPADSAFSVNFPGPLSEYTCDNDGIKKYIYDDPANGSYYYILRMNHFAKLYGQSSSYMLQRIDSILYESIPGKILKKEVSFSNNGYPGYNIENETETGDREQYRIYVTPDEIILFKMGGTGDYVSLGDEAETFFGSIAFYDRGQNISNEFTSKTSGYSINFPVNKCYYTSNDPGENRKDLLTSASANNEEYYFLMCSKLFDFSSIEEDTFELNMLAETFARSIGYSIRTRYYLKVNEHPALNTTISKDGKEAELRIVISGPFYYMAGCICNDIDKRKIFLNSLKLQNISYSKPFRNYSDTSFRFSTKMPYEEGKLMDLVKTESSGYYCYYCNSYNKLPEEYLDVDKYRYYLNIESGEVIGLCYDKFSSFYSVKSLNEFWKSKVDINYKNRFIIKYLDSATAGNESKRIMLLTDTNSTRAILVRMLLKENVLYTLLANVDTINGPSYFVQTFFDNFIPADSIKKRELCNNEFYDKWFARLYSPDTAVSRKARLAISYALLGMKDENAAQLMHLIKDTTFMHLSIYNKGSIIKRLGELKSKEIVPFLKELYLSYTDSVYIQFAILDALAKQKSETAYKCIPELLSSNLIVSSSTYDIPNLFDFIEDSLKLAQMLFPGMMKFTKYEEYRKPVYALLSKLIEKGYVKKSSYAAYKNDIIRDAQYDLNKLISAKELKSTPYYYNYSDYYYGFSRYYYPNPADNIKESEKVFYYYGLLLRPFYNEEVKNTILKKIISSGSDELAIALYCHYLKHDIKISDTLFAHYANDPETVSTLYRHLVYNKLKNLTSDTCFSQENLVVSELFRDKFNLVKDTVVLVAKKYVRSKKGNGYVYIFKAQKHGDDIWTLGYSGIHSASGRKINFAAELYSTSFKFETEKQMNDEINNLMQKVRKLGHSRASDYSYYSDYSYIY